MLVLTLKEDSINGKSCPLVVSSDPRSLKSPSVSLKELAGTSLITAMLSLTSLVKAKAALSLLMISLASNSLNTAQETVLAALKSIMVVDTVFLTPLLLSARSILLNTSSIVKTPTASTTLPSLPSKSTVEERVADVSLETSPPLLLLQLPQLLTA